MLKNRTYLYGLGVGLIAGAILLQVMILAKQDATEYSEPPAEEMNAAELKQHAAKYYQVFEKGTKLYTEAEFEKQLQHRIQEEQDKFVSSTNSNGAKPSEDARTIAVYIQANLPASSVTEILYRSGVIRDRKALEDELDRQRLTNKIQVGVHLFEGTQDLQQVIKNLTTEQ